MRCVCVCVCVWSKNTFIFLVFLIGFLLSETFLILDTYIEKSTSHFRSIRRRCFRQQRTVILLRVCVYTHTHTHTYVCIEYYGTILHSERELSIKCDGILHPRREMKKKKNNTKNWSVLVQRSDGRTDFDETFAAGPVVKRCTRTKRNP